MPIGYNEEDEILNTLADNSPEENELLDVLTNNSSDMDPMMSSPENANRIYDATVSGNKQRMTANLLRSFQEILKAGAPGSGFRPDSSIADSIEKDASAQLTNVKDAIKRESDLRSTELKSKLVKAKNLREEEAFKLNKQDKLFTIRGKKYDLLDQNKTRNPKSKESQLAQDHVIDQLKQMGRPYDEKTIRSQSAKQLITYNKSLQDLLVQVMKDKNSSLERQHELIKQEKDLGYKDKKLAEDAQVKRDVADLKKQADVSKEERKEEVQVRKEDRKTFKELDNNEKDVKNTIDRLENISKQFETYSKKSLGGTGPFATMFGAKKYTDEDSQALDARFKKVGLDEMSKMFQGMSKAVDSDAERRAFEATQLSLTNDDDVNRQVIQDKMAAANSLLMKIKAQKEQIQSRDKGSSPQQEAQQSQSPEPKYGETTTRDGKTYKWNPVVQKYQLIGE